MGQIWDSTPTRTTGRHRARPTARQRINRRGLLKLAIAAVLLATVTATLGAIGSTPHPAPAAFTSHTTPIDTTAISDPVDITGLDLHDGMLYQVGATYYFVGTEYGCGFQWRVSGTPWCGFGVSTAPSATGPWSTPTLLFPPDSTDPETGTTWAAECGGTGAGCFVPRMIQRSGWGYNDGVWILWWSDPREHDRGENSYWAMGCDGPAGPCGATAGAPYGSTHKVAASICTGNGDASFFPDNTGHMVMTCTTLDQRLDEEQLDEWGVDGDGVGSTNLAGLTNVESSGVYQDPTSGTWIMTYSDPNCGYCEGDGTGYATAASPYGPWTAPSNPNPAWNAPIGGRRDLSATSCGGQPDTVITLNGTAYEKIDLWLGTSNEAGAGTHLEPLRYNAPTSTPGTPWQPFAPWSCA